MFHSLTLLLLLAHATAGRVERDIAYAEPKNARQMLDVYAPASGSKHPIVIWIHGGGWRNGDKSEVDHKPDLFVPKGYVFAAMSYRFWPTVVMETIVRDVAKSIRWVHDNAARYGGDPNRIILTGHSAGAQLAALICTDQRYLKAEGLSPAILKGCIPVDGDTYDVPAIIATAEARRKSLGQPEPTAGHRQKFGDPEHQRDLSAVTHVARNKGIPPFLILHVADHPDTTAQAQRLHQALRDAAIPTRIFGASATDHVKLNRDLGAAGDPATKIMLEFIEETLRK